MTQSLAHLWPQIPSTDPKAQKGYKAPVPQEALKAIEEVASEAKTEVQEALSSAVDVVEAVVGLAKSEEQ